MKDPRPWTPEEDQILRHALAFRGGLAPVENQHHLLTALTNLEDENINWLEVASLLEGRSNKDCRKRWTYSLSPTIRKGPWTGEEDILLRAGVNQYGTRWVWGSRTLATFEC